MAESGGAVRSPRRGGSRRAGVVRPPRSPAPGRIERAGPGRQADVADQPPVDPARLFAGPMVPLRHVAAVRDQTVVLVFIPGEPIGLKEPGALLLPERNPFRSQMKVMAVNTAPVRLRLVVRDLHSADGRPLDRLECRVTVSLANGHGGSRLLQLAARHAPDLGAYLAETVRRGLETALRTAVRSTPAAELSRPDWAATLTERWLPRTFASETLVMLDFAADASGLPDREPAGDTAATRPPPAVRPSARPWPPEPVDPGPPGRAGRRPPTGEGPRPPAPDHTAPRSGPASGPLELTVDAQLRRIWQRRLGGEVRGLAGAKVGARATVIAVVDQDPPAYESRQLWEDFCAAYRVSTLTVAVCTATGYPDLVHQWWAGLGFPPELGVAVRDDFPDSLVIGLPEALDPDSGADRRWQGPDGSQAAALRRLLPHTRIEFRPAGTGPAHR